MALSASAVKAGAYCAAVGNSGCWRSRSTWLGRCWQPASDRRQRAITARTDRARGAGTGDSCINGGMEFGDAGGCSLVFQHRQKALYCGERFREGEDEADEGKHRKRVADSRSDKANQSVIFLGVRLAKIDQMATAEVERARVTSGVRRPVMSMPLPAA